MIDMINKKKHIINYALCPFWVFQNASFEVHTLWFSGCLVVDYFAQCAFSGFEINKTKFATYFDYI